MLDAETKARIDSARDILVGKVPDPKSQVEQITIALIYKFMDDMDRQSEELGGKATFFAGAFKKYRWAQLLDKRYGGHERLLLYAEGIEKMNENKNIPQLFRDIFRGVFLPYRDPETLNLFLKEIDGFSYDHSERLGDAFEYLLSVLGTQGDAGQFRTPRHIIDFIVAVVDPKKNETVLDPACGTAGFLISAYKHILKQGMRHTPCAGGTRSVPDTLDLTPDERAVLMSNFRGYDIAPDMVRLSRANLYLHGFPNPVIHEYDTLTSEERWDERCDVIMANPPFMTPKGGIRPHNRFSIQAKRSEVLFVDYIAEHLNPGGRAGVIVPEGIIFQGQKAYKALRKMLVENYLWAVVNLPAGVFNPYSGVKTSILLLDRNLAKRTAEVLFVKVENDGFDLGAQRRPIEGTDLTEALKILLGHKKAQRTQERKMALTVSRQRLLESTDINLSGDRYRTAAVRGNTKWPMVKLGEVCQFVRGVTYEKGDESCAPTGIAVLRANNIDLPSHTLDLSEIKYLKEGTQLPAEKRLLKGDIFICTASGSKNHLGKVAFIPENMTYYFGGFMGTIRCRAAILPRLAFHLLTSPSYDGFVQGLTAGVNINNLRSGDLLAFEIPLPPLAEQERIVAELDGYRRVTEAACQILASYKPTIRIDPRWPWCAISELAKMQYGLSSPLRTDGKGFRTFRMNELVDGLAVDNGEMKRAAIGDGEFRKYRLNRGDILFNRTNSFEHVGRTGIFDLDGEYAFASYLIRLTPDRAKALPMFLNRWMNTPEFQMRVKGYASRAIGQANINASNLAQCAVPLPPLDVQRRIVGELEAERRLVEANRELIARMEVKTKAKLAEVWGEEEEGGKAVKEEKAR
jgi:type I restriction enzyme M protein